MSKNITSAYCLLLKAFSILEINSCSAFSVETPSLYEKTFLFSGNLVKCVSWTCQKINLSSVFKIKLIRLIGLNGLAIE